MDKYLVSVILVSISVGLCDVLLPEHNDIERLVKFIGVLVILVVIVSPIGKLIQSFDEKILYDIKENIIGLQDDIINDYNERLNQYLNEYSIDLVEQEIKIALEERYNIPNDECSVTVKTMFEDEQMGILNIQILLSGASIFKNPYDIEKYISDLWNVECEVLIKAKG